MIHPNQEQHRISQVYLRSWSFKDKKNADTLCVRKFDDPISYYQAVRLFTAETNLFDTTLFDEGEERFFDKKSIIAETNFHKVLKTLKAGSYDGQVRIYLAEFASNLFVRQESTFDFFRFITEKKLLRDKLLREIAILDEKDAQLIEAVYEEMATDPDHSLDSKVSAILAQAWKHFSEVFKRFNHIILKAPQDRDWYTTDNPVIVKQMGDDGWVVGPEAEIYFPISKECLLYSYCEGMHPENLLTRYTEDQITEVSLEVFDDIMFNTIIKSKPKYFILSEDMGHLDARDGSELPWYRPPQDITQKDQPEFSFMNTSLPPRIDDTDLKRLLTKMNITRDPVILDVETDSAAVENECIAIVDKMVSEFGGNRVLGWQFWEGAYLIEAEFHAVWKTVAGSLRDVSFKKNKVTKIMFVEDPTLVYNGTQINNIRLSRVADVVMDHFIETCDILFKLYNKEGRARLYGQGFVNSLSAKQLANLQRVEYFKQILLKFLNEGGNENSVCFCNRGGKYKDCHALMMRELHELD